MPVHVRWFNPQQTAIHVEVSGYYTWADVYVSLQQQVALLEDTNEPVCILIDLRHTNFLPSGALPNLRRLVAAVNSIGGLKVILGANTVLEMMFRSVGCIYPEFEDTYRFARTLDEAKRLLQEHDCLMEC